MTSNPGDTPTPNPDGLSAARAVAGWELGDPGWANVLIRAYLNPAEAMTKLEADKGNQCATCDGGGCGDCA
jgi:hypothetical protein